MKKCFKNFSLINGTGEEILNNAYMIVSNGLIEEIGNNYDNQNDDVEIIDLCRNYIMPGLIDCHIHSFFSANPDPTLDLLLFNEVDHIINAMKNLEAQIKSGVTFIRDVGGVNHYDIALKKYVNNGTIKAPNMFCSGKIVTMTGGHGHFLGREADGVDEVRKAVREQLKAGADVIKVISSGGVMTPGVNVNAYQFNVDELKAAVEEAHKAGKKVCTHCHSTQGIKNSIIAGIDSIEHATLLTEETVEMLVKTGTYIVPTLAAPYYIVNKGEKAGIPKYAVDKAKEIFAKHIKGFEMAYKAGVNIAMGTDAGTPFNEHGKSSFELQLMTEAGMSNMDAIITSTKNSADLIGISDRYGTLKEGKYADFIVLSENPLDNIKAIHKPIHVYKHGELI